MNADLGSPGEGAQGQAAIADQPVGGRDDSLDRRPDRRGVHLRQDGVNRRAAPIARKVFDYWLLRDQNPAPKPLPEGAQAASQPGGAQ